MRANPRICCAVDFSPEARAALEHAADLAARFEGALTVVHVDDRPHLASFDALAPTTQEARDSSIELEHQLEDWAQVARARSARPVDFVLLGGAPADAIVAFARERGVDAVVMATRTPGPEDLGVIGSVAAAVVRTAPCTVTVVRRSPR
jgi:nucleotide-binding universal stress UspA family protein